MYFPPWFLFNKHFETIYPSLFRKVKLKEYQRERITLPDGDFLDLDWLAQGSSNLIIISHGLEGDSQRAYVKGMAKTFFDRGFDVLAWNYRGCSGEVNKALRFYHSGATDDLGAVVDHAASKKYQRIFLIGFSLGGNLTLKFAGEQPINSRIKGISVFSVPIDLHTSCIQLSKPSNFIYSNRFVRALKKKVIDKAKMMSNLNIDDIEKIKTIIGFDDRFTAPLHGYKNAVDYYQQCSAIRFLKGIKTPTLIVNAKNDPFLSEKCFPSVNENSFIKFQFPERGGHVGFASFNGNGLYWSEQVALDFIIPLSQ